MKFFVFALLFVTASVAHADSIEVVGGSITAHLLPFSTYSPKVDPYKSLAGQLGQNTGVIANPLFGLRYVGEDERTYWTAAGFFMENSVGQPSAGFLTSLGRKFFNGHLYAGGVLGAYEQCDSCYIESGLWPYKFTTIGDTDIVPVIGIEINFRVNISEKYYLKLNNIVTPLLTNTTIGFGIEL